MTEINELHDFEKEIERELSHDARVAREGQEREVSSHDDHNKESPEKCEQDNQKECEAQEQEPKKLEALKKAFIAARGVAAIAAHRASEAGHHLKELFEHGR